MSSTAKDLIKTINFILPVQKNKGTPQQQFCLIQNGWIVAADDYTCIASPIDMAVDACLSTFQLKTALVKSKEDDLSFTQIDERTLTVKSGNLKATVACNNPAILNLKAPDDLMLVLTDDFKAALKAVDGLCAENVSRPELGAVKVSGACCYAASSTGKAVIEAFHGFDIPGAHLIPKVAVKAVINAKVALAGVGWSNNTMTFHFENGAFIKTALHAGSFPSIEHLFETNIKEKTKIPEDFFQALGAIAPFSTQGYVYFEDGHITSDSVENAASTYYMDGLNVQGILEIALLIKVKSQFKEAIFDENKVVFFGDIARGVIAKARPQHAE